MKIKNITIISLSFLLFQSTLAVKSKKNTDKKKKEKKSGIQQDFIKSIKEKIKKKKNERLKIEPQKGQELILTDNEIQGFLNKETKKLHKDLDTLSEQEIKTITGMLTMKEEILTKLELRRKKTATYIQQLPEQKKDEEDQWPPIVYYVDAPRNNNKPEEKIENHNKQKPKEASAQNGSNNNNHNGAERSIISRFFALLNRPYAKVIISMLLIGAFLKIISSATK